ncbi:MAG TPA: alpha/beta fold hydrolase, partial [Candidatus Nanoarchaeia archaeon]|nr:alpha/beta fold hydrolase [Candidatus Nanoarchaeia archaeon]
GGEIQANKDTWVVIHGRESYASASPTVKGTEEENNMYRLAGALEEFAKLQKVPQQILVADWRSFAGANEKLASLEGTVFIREVAAALQEMLQGYGIPVGDMNIVGHSWGTYVGYEVARMLPGKVRSLVALDSATNPWPLAALIGSADSFADMNFRDVAENSWAFEGSMFGSNKKATTANMTMEIFHPFAVSPITQHNLVAETFARIVRDAANDSDDTVSQYFHLDKLLGTDQRQQPWREDGYGMNPVLPDGYEGKIGTVYTGGEESDGTPIYDLSYVTYVLPGNTTQLTTDHFKP